MNGLAVCLCIGVAFLGVLIAYARRRHREQVRDEADAAMVRPPTPWPLDPQLRVARAVRESYDGLPYRGGKGWARK